MAGWLGLALALADGLGPVDRRLSALDQEERTSERDHGDDRRRRERASWLWIGSSAPATRHGADVSIGSGLVTPEQTLRRTFRGLVLEPGRDHDVWIGSGCHASAFLTETLRASASSAARSASVA